MNTTGYVRTDTSYSNSCLGFKLKLTKGIVYLNSPNEIARIDIKEGYHSSSPIDVRTYLRDGTVYTDQFGGGLSYDRDKAIAEAEAHVEGIRGQMQLWYVQWQQTQPAASEPITWTTFVDTPPSKITGCFQSDVSGGVTDPKIFEEESK